MASSPLDAGEDTTSLLVNVTGAGLPTVLGAVAPGPVTELGSTGRYVFSAPTGTLSVDGDPDYEPRVTDGTAAGTMQLAELDPPSNNGTDSLGAEPTGFTQVAGSQVVFLASTGPTQTGLFATDGTGAGTVELLAGLANYNQSVTGLADGRAVLVTPSPTSNDTGPRRAYARTAPGPAPWRCCPAWTRASAAIPPHPWCCRSAATAC